jgi:hypothetical protein
MSYASEQAGKRADAARRQFSNKALARGRAGRSGPGLADEQAAYRNRFREVRTRKPVVIVDVNGNYPDQEWTRPQ